MIVLLPTAFLPSVHSQLQMQKPSMCLHSGSREWNISAIKGCVFFEQHSRHLWSLPCVSDLPEFLQESQSLLEESTQLAQTLLSLATNPVYQEMSKPVDFHRVQEKSQGFLWKWPKPSQNEKQNEESSICKSNTQNRRSRLLENKVRKCFCSWEENCQAQK